MAAPHTGTWRRGARALQTAPSCFLACVLTCVLTMAMAPATCLAAPSEPENASGVPNRKLSVDPTGVTEGYSAVLYNNTNGMPTSESNAIAATSEGFIWIGSYSGLIRYDGETFERYHTTGGIASVTSLFVDSHDRLWIGTNDVGLAMMDQGKITQWREDAGLDSLRIMSIMEDEAGQVYASTATGIAMVDNKLALHMLEDPRLENVYVEDLRLGSDGLVVGTTSASDVFTLRDGNVVDYIGHEDTGLDSVTYILPDNDRPGYVYLGTDGSKVARGTLEDGLHDLETWDISPLSGVSCIEEIDGQLWICARNGVGVIRDGRFSSLDYLPMNNSVGHVMTDYQGNLWFTSTRLGVMKIVPNRFSNLFDRYNLPEAVVNTTCASGDDLLVGTDEGLLVLGPDGQRATYPLKSARTAGGEDLGARDLIELTQGMRIRSIIRDSQDRLWVSTYQGCGLLRYDHGDLVAFTESDGLLSSRIRVVHEREDGSFLVVNTGGVSVIEGDEVTRSYGQDDGIANVETLTVTEGFDHEIVLGSNGGGIYVIDGSGTRNVSTKDGLSSGIVMRIKRDDARHVYWVVTSNTLSYMTDDFHVHVIGRFPYSNNYDLYENDKGDIWVLSSNGIYVVPAADLIANGALRPHFFGLGNGLPGIATSNSYSELTDEGDLYIASTTGVTKVNTDEDFESVEELRAVVPYIDVDGTRLYPDKDGSFTVPRDALKVTINSFVFNYSLTDPQVTYHLEGFDPGRTSVSRSDLAPVDYTNLRGGTYEFVMRIADSMGHGFNEIRVTLVKEKSFYETVWFYVVTIACALGLIAFIVNLYVRRKTAKLERQRQENLTFIREITEAFAKVIDMKDNYTRGHSSRVAKYTAMLTRKLGKDEETVERYYRIALLHDIGKIGIPSDVLNKPGKLTDEEYELIKSHTTKGYEALKDISIMPELAIGAQSHHERPDGRGYPNHLEGADIPEVARIIAVADCFDAMYSNRPYRKRMNFEKAVSIIRDVSGTQLTPEVVDAFLELVKEGEFRAPDDVGGGTTENIENIRGKDS